MTLYSTDLVGLQILLQDIPMVGEPIISRDL
jgi:hypothetical protein